jgi:hypothetical protein
LQIGINYFGTSSELKGCINDARNVEKFLWYVHLSTVPEDPGPSSLTELGKIAG